jgi:hypothetical protein
LSVFIFKEVLSMKQILFKHWQRSFRCNFE